MLSHKVLNIPYLLTFKNITMKKFTLIIIAAAAVISASATDVKKKWMTRMYTESGISEYKYFYDAADRLDSVKIDDDFLDCTSKITYNADGLQIAEDGWQLLEGGTEYTHTIHVDYKYDGSNLVERANYNYYGGEMTLGGVIVYEYENGRLSKECLYWDLDKTDLYSTTTYTYNESGLLASVATYAKDFFTSEEKFSDGAEYIYDDAGRLVERKFLMGDFYTGEPSYSGGEQWEYDEAGNVSLHIYYSSTPDNPSAKNLYEYDTDVTVAEAALPLSIEDEDIISELSANIKTKRLYYAQDLNSGNLMLYDTYYFEYSDSRPSASINGSTVQKPQGGILLSGNTLVLNGSSGSTPLRVYNANGNLVMSERNLGRSTVDISSLPSGVYVARMGGAVLKFRKN